MIIDAALGGQPVRIVAAPPPVLPAGMYGLDVETTYMTDLGQFDPDFRVRLVQIATRDTAWVLRTDVAEQRSSATETLARQDVSFCSHSNMDVLSVHTGLSIAITGRNLDTLNLARMAFTDKLADRDLKALTAKLIGPELGEAEAALHARFAQLWAERGEALWQGFTLAVAEDGFLRVPVRVENAATGEVWEGTLESAPWCASGRLGTKLRARIRAVVRKHLGGLPACVFLAWRDLQEWKPNAATAVVHEHGWATIPADDRAYVLYAGLDAIACRRLAEILPPLTRAPVPLLRAERFLADQANRIQIEGMRVDTDLLAEQTAEREKIIGEAEARIAEITGGGKARGAGLLEWFAGNGVDWDAWPGERTKTGAPSLAKGNVRLLPGVCTTPQSRAVAAELLAIQPHAYMLTKLREIARRLTPAGRVHPVLLPNGATTTARWSASGPNFQNMSKRDPAMRGLFIPDDGCAFVTIDFDQVELRVVAALAREEKMLRAIRDGVDLHALTVSELAQAGVAIERDAAKITNFLIVYGGGAEALHSQTGIPIEEARRIIAAWRERYSGIAFYAGYLGMQQHGVRTITGRWLPVTYDAAGRARTYANINYVVQSSARDLLTDAWMRLPDPDVVRLPIHDELLLHVPAGEVERVKTEAEAAMRFDFRGVPISATAVELREADGASRWMTAKRAEKIAKGEAA